MCKSAAVVAILAVLLSSSQARGQDQERAPWNFAPLPVSDSRSCGDCSPNPPFTPPMFGDQFQFGFNFGFQSGFNFAGGFSLGFQGGGGFNLAFGSTFQGGFQGGAPIAVARGAFKIGENESPRPQDRVFATYNYYDNVLKSLQVHREMIGVEKTLFNGQASAEIRLPFIQNQADTGESESEVADLTGIFKYALINEPDRVLSAGLAVTAPTSDIPTVLIVRSTGIEEIHPTLLQPFVGYRWSANNFFLHGFSSVMVPTDSRDGTLLFNDIGVGYWWWTSQRLVTAVIPTFEVHVNTPLTNRDIAGFADSVNLTGGSYFLLGDRWCLGIAIGTPVTGPRLFAFEALANLNWSF